MVYGDNKLYNVALVVPDLPNLKQWASDNGVSGSDEEIVKDQKVKDFMLKEVEKVSADFKGFERVKRIALTAEDFTAENSMLTPSLKVKRRVVMQRYGKDLDALYSEPAKKESAAASA
jgi:long-chain acyl-CoA synthetase